LHCDRIKKIRFWFKAKLSDKTQGETRNLKEN